MAQRSAPPEAASVRTVIQPSRGWVSLGLDELWRYRELLYFLVWRSIKVRYKQTVLGVTWAVIQPLMTMVVFTVVFGRLAKVPSDGLPYQLFAFAALVPWTLFTKGLSQSASSLVGNQALLTKIYLPRLALPIAAVLSGLVDFVLAFGILLAMQLAFGVVPTAGIVWLPLLLMLTLVTSLGVGLWLSALNVMFRDIRYTVPFLLQMWLFATPIAYPSSLVPEKWRLLYGLNPMAGVVDGFRWALLGADTRPGPMILVSAFAAFTLLVSGAYYFRRTEKIFADVV